MQYDESKFISLAEEASVNEIENVISRKYDHILNIHSISSGGTIFWSRIIFMVIYEEENLSHNELVPAPVSRVTYTKASYHQKWPQVI